MQEAAPDLAIVKAEAKFWHSLGLQPIPLRLLGEVKTNGKKCIGKEARDKAWNTKKYGPEGTQILFDKLSDEGEPLKSNLGIVLTKDFVAIDYDNPIASKLAPYFMLDSWEFKRKTDAGDLLVRNLYKLTEGKVGEKITFNIPGTAKDIIELLGDKNQIVAPPSIHKTGAVLEWGKSEEDLKLTELTLDELLECLNRLAGAVLIYDLWAELEGHRNEAIPALAGAMLHADWAPEDVLETLTVILESMPYELEDDAADRVTYIERTIDRFANDETVTGLSTFAKLENVKQESVDQLATWWQLGSKDVIDILDMSEVPKAETKAEAEDKPKIKEIEIYEPAPWEEPVNGEQVLDECLAILRRHVLCDSPTDHYIIVLWIVHTYLFKVFSVTPRLLIDAPEPECGKTLLLFYMLGGMVNKPMEVESMTLATFFRLAAGYKPTFLIDEVDAFLQEDSDFISALNSGWTPKGGVPRCEGDQHTVVVYPTHAPVAMSGIRIKEKLPPATVSRSHVINMQRAIAGQIADEDAYDHEIHQEPLRIVGRKFARWIQDNEEAIRAANPVLPKDAKNRIADKWRPLYKVASVAGKRWLERVAEAYVESKPEVKITKSLRLITDIKTVMEAYGEQPIIRNDMVIQLAALPTSRWSNYNYSQMLDADKVISPDQLTALLKGYILTTNNRVNGEQKKSYNYGQLNKMWKRYALSKEQAEDD